MYGIMLRVWGDYACFTRPEMKVERVSYDVMTPSAARGILEAIHWKPAIRWLIDEIHVLNPIKFTNIRRNEVGDIISVSSLSKAMKGDAPPMYLDSNASRQQRATLMLQDVDYLIRAHFELTDKKGESDTPEKHYNMFLRRARNGQCYHTPYFGCREFPVAFELIENELPEPIKETRDLGWMLYDIDYADNMNAIFFRAAMENGVINIAECLKEVAS